MQKLIIFVFLPILLVAGCKPESTQGKPTVQEMLDGLDEYNRNIGERVSNNPGQDLQPQPAGSYQQLAGHPDVYLKGFWERVESTGETNHFVSILFQAERQKVRSVQILNMEWGMELEDVAINCTDQNRTCSVGSGNEQYFSFTIANGNIKILARNEALKAVMEKNSLYAPLNCSKVSSPWCSSN